MALLRPTLLSVPAFDATEEYTFVFTVAEGGTQITGNRLTIRDNTTNEVVYNETETTFKYEHTLNSSVLVNGKDYNATVNTIDSQGNESATSVPVQFWCYTTPVLELTNFPATSIVNNSSFEFELSYTQNENERINLYEFNLYNVSNQLVATSGVLYAVDGTPPFTASYLFSGFTNLTEYKIEATAVTINNTVITTGVRQFSVRYTTPNVFSLVTLTNNCSEGYVALQSNLLSIEGESQPSPPIYIDGKEVDLTDENNYVDWKQGYNINGDFLTRLWFRSPNPNSKILQYANVDGGNITVEYREGYIDDDDTTTKLAYIALTVNTLQGTQYFIYSDYISILADTDYYNLWIRRINNIYQLQFNAL